MSSTTTMQQKLKNRKPGLTAKGDQRQYVRHSYSDRSSDIIDSVTTSDENTLRLYRENSVGGPFPLKLQIVLKVTEQLGQQHIISWLPHGRSFMIHRPREFEQEIMCKFFKQTKLTSFRRQLNLYDFQRITHGRDAGSYYHELFLRGRPLLAKRMLRRKVKGTKIRASSSPDDEPDFYTMPFMGPISDGARAQPPVPNPHDLINLAAGGNLSALSGLQASNERNGASQLPLSFQGSLANGFRQQPHGHGMHSHLNPANLPPSLQSQLNPQQGRILSDLMQSQLPQSYGGVMSNFSNYATNALAASNIQNSFSSLPLNERLAAVANLQRDLEINSMSSGMSGLHTAAGMRGLAGSAGGGLDPRLGGYLNESLSGASSVGANNGFRSSNPSGTVSSNISSTFSSMSAPGGSVGGGGVGANGSPSLDANNISLLNAQMNVTGVGASGPNAGNSPNNAAENAAAALNRQTFLLQQQHQQKEDQQAVYTQLLRQRQLLSGAMMAGAPTGAPGVNMGAMGNMANMVQFQQQQQTFNAPPSNFQGAGIGRSSSSVGSLQKKDYGNSNIPIANGGGAPPVLEDRTTKGILKKVLNARVAVDQKNDSSNNDDHAGNGAGNAQNNKEQSEDDDDNSNSSNNDDDDDGDNSSGSSVYESTGI